MKKYYMGLLAVVLAFMIAACGGGATVDDTPADVPPADVPPAESSPVVPEE